MSRGRVSVTFQMQEASALTVVTARDADEAAARRAAEMELQTRLGRLQAEAAAMKQRLGEKHANVVAVSAEIENLKMRLAEFESGDARPRSLFGSRGVIDTTFSMDIGETVVVGTSRMRGGDKALIAAHGRPARRRHDAKRVISRRAAVRAYRWSACAGSWSVGFDAGQRGQHDVADHLQASRADRVERVLGRVPRFVVEVDDVDRRHACREERHMVVLHPRRLADEGVGQLQAVWPRPARGWSATASSCVSRRMRRSRSPIMSTRHERPERVASDPSCLATST